MSNLKTLLCRAACALAVTTAAVLPAAAQDFPNRPVRLIVPWAAGGSTDLSLRAFAEAAGKYLGQPMIVENKPGAAGTLGPASMVGSVRPDGYTVAQMPISMFRMPYMQKTNFDPLTDFDYIIHLTGYTFGVVVRSDAQWQTFDQLVSWAKANPGKLTYATPGTGTSLHITMEQIAGERGITWTQVPYKGSAETVNALLSGEVMSVADATGWGPMVEAGKFRLLVTWGPERTKRYPTVPTLKELGYGIVSNSPYGIAGPKGMDPAVVKTLHDAFRKALEDPVHLAAMEKFDQQLDYKNSADYRAFVVKTVEEQKAMIERLGLKQQ